MGTLELSEEVSRRILASKKPYGQFDLGGRKYVFAPNNNKLDELNPTHILDLGLKIGKLNAEGKISYLGKCYNSGGIIRSKGGVTTILVYRVESQLQAVA